ncbi:bifunctional N(6)-L-threonylcarbamoyladenine synthase/serine/threonine protein kinase [Candidatus Woesearchaeota archaeon]|nr:bifunctional N(6)-L-threonylcarbamoyladenine synthase/serine/threonine protein kinase [Candidatus Woesearchaeota archaeon]
MKYCLGIESTAHTFGASVVTFSGKILSNVKDIFTTKKGGMIPAEVADHHVNVCGDVIQKALDNARVSLKDITLISYSASPGLGPCLRVGAMAARSLAVMGSIKLVGVNHCIAHLEIGRLLTKAKDPVLLYASGANTQVIAYEGKKYRIFGETLDMGIGNFLDSFARDLGLGFPGGPKIEELARKGKKLIALPYSVKGMDVSFGGLQTNLRRKVESRKYKKEELCYSVQETVFAMLIEVTERAMAHCDKKELVLGGGVACNKRLQEMARIMCKDRKATCYLLENQYYVDNAAMIAWLGILQFKAGESVQPEKADIDPYTRTDDVVVKWR